MYVMHKLASMGAMLCNIVVVVVVVVRTYVRAREPLTADEDDHTKMNARALYLWGSAWRPSAAGAPLKPCLELFFGVCNASKSRTCNFPFNCLYCTMRKTT